VGADGVQQEPRPAEDLSRAIYKNWFIDFAPVRAKAAGERRPDFGNRSLTSFRRISSPLGDIPLGWGVEPIGNLV